MKKILIKFYDPSGASHFGQASITRTTSVNGGLSLTGEVFDGDDVLNGLDYGWWLNFDNEKYVITYKKLSDDTNTIVFDAVQQFFWDFAKVALHSQYTGSHEYAFYLNQLFNRSGYTYNNDANVQAFEKENWGYKNKLSLFNDIMDQADVEFEVHNETVHIAKQIGSDLTSFVRKGINLSDLTEEIKISDFATYAKGYGAFEDSQDPSKGRLEVEYRSELADKFGVLEMDPIVDERYTIANNLIAELKNHVDATYTVSMTMNIYDLESAGYPNYESPKVGDWILAIDEALNFKRKIRIIKLEEQFDVTGKRIGYTATCGDLSIVDQYTNLQGSLDSKVQRIQESIDSVAASANGKNSNYYGAKEPVNADEGDLWFDQSNSDPDKWTIKQWLNGRWEQITLNPGEVSDKVNAVKAEAESAIDNAKSASEKADQLAAKYDDTSSLANQALDQAVNAKSDASSAVAQASSAAADSKDAQQIAGAVSQSYKTLTDGSTMTIAELESGLAVKLTKSDLDGYATQTWAQNQINATADGINATLSSVKTTVDDQTTSINDLKADSSSFKSKFTTVNDTLGKQATDIGTLQASSKELSSNFNSLDSDNTTNKNDISQLKQTATEFNSTLMTVQTQVNDSSVGINLLRNTKDYSDWSKSVGEGNVDPTIVRDYALTDLIQITGLTNSGKFSASMAGGGPVYLVPGQSYTFSVYAKANTKSGAGLGINLGLYGDYTSQMQNGSALFITPTMSGDWYRYSVTFVAKGSGPFGGWRVLASSTDSLDDLIAIYLWGLKLEKGIVATNYSNNPTDNATVTAVSSISQTVDAIKTTVRGKVDNDVYQSKVTQLNNQITSVVGQVNNLGQRNMVANSQFQYDYLDGTSWTGGTTDVWYKTDYAWSWVNGYQGICINQPINTDNWYNLFSKKIVIGADISTPWSASAYVNIDTVGINTLLSVEFYDTSGVRIGHKESYKDSRGMELIKVENYIPPAGAKTVCFAFSVHGGGHLAMISPMLVNASSVGLYTPDTASWAEFQQTASNINLKVSKDGVINAINVSNEGTSIYGSKLHITAATYIDNAVIKDAMIANLSADKLTAGTINAANINVINLNANNITTGTISGSNLSINLNTGNVEFQKGRIHSADNTIDINIDNKYISVASDSNRVMLKNGEMQFVEPTLFDTEDSPYFRIHNRGGYAYGGAEMVGRDYVTVSNAANSSDFFTYNIGVETFSGLFTGYDRASNAWRPTKVAGADRGVIISGGSGFSTTYIPNLSPRIIVGYDNNSSNLTGGNRILLDAAFVHSFPTYKKTSSQSPNVYVSTDGALLRSTSASKYKTNIVRGYSTDYGKKLIQLPTATWIDKASLKRYNEDPSQPAPSLNYGMIAEDLADAGLENLVVRNDEGGLEGIQYDRIVVALLPLLSEWSKIINNQEKEINELKNKKGQ